MKVGALKKSNFLFQNVYLLNVLVSRFDLDIPCLIKINQLHSFINCLSLITIEYKKINEGLISKAFP